MATIASLKVNILGDSTGLTTSLKNATDKMQAFGNRMSEIGSTLSTRLTLPIVGFGALAVKAASDAEETFSKFDTVFRNVSENADEAFQTLRENYGLSSKAAKQLLSDTGDLLTGFGFSQQAALELSTEVNKLAVDLASFTNFSGGAEGASQALTKALLGERESVKSLGIAILEEDVQKRVAINTSKGLIFETERQAKAYATLQIAQEQSKNAIGDYARTQGGFANQVRLLRSRFEDLSVEMGQILLPIMQRLVNFVGDMISAFRSFDEDTKSLIVGLSLVVAAIGPALFAFKALTAVFIAMASPIAIKVAAITALAAALKFLYDNVGPIGDRFKYAFEMARNAIIDMVVNSLRGLSALFSIVPSLSVSFDALAISLLESKTELEGFEFAEFTSFADSMKGALRSITGAITNFMSAMSASAPATKPMEQAFERMNIKAQKVSNSVGGIQRGTLQLATGIPVVEKMGIELAIANQFAMQFTDSFGAGMANVVVQGEKLVDVLKNIGKLMLSSAIQTAITLLLRGTSAFGIAGGSTGLIGKLFGSSLPTGAVGSVAPQSASLSLDGQFQIKGTDLVYVMNRAERSFR